MSIGKYKVMPIYMLRTPIKSQEFYNNIFENGLNDNEQIDLIKAICKDNIIKESIQIASRDLSLMISGDDNDLSEDVILSILKYIIRMSTRSTPFGVFSGVSIGQFNNNTKVILNSNIGTKTARVDLEWLCNVINKIENDDRVIEYLKIRFNEICYSKGERMVNPYVTNCGIQNKNDFVLNSSIRDTKQVEFVKENSKEYVKFNDLYKKIKDSNPNVEDKKIELFLKNLLKNEFLLSELRFPLVNEDPLSFLINKLQDIDVAKDYYEVLIKVQKLISQYNSLEIGNGNKKLHEVYEYMKEIYQCKNYLQVDTKINTNKNSISIKVAEEIEKSVEALIKIYYGNAELNNIAEYKEEFLEKYGHYIEVPVMQLLDEDLGLGAPAGYIMPDTHRIIRNNNDTQKALKLKELLKYKYLNSVKKNNEEITIDDKDIDYLCNEEKSKEFDLPDSMEIYVKIIGESEEKIDAGIFNLEITGCIGSLSAGNSFGRFNHLFNIKNNPVEYFEKAKCEIRNSEYIEVEIYEFPSSARLGNVAINNNGLKNYISIASNDCLNKEKIKIEDIVIGVDSVTNRFYAKSKKLNKKLKISSTNMLNPLRCSNILRFLQDISINNKINFIDSINALKIEGFIYTPRIVYKKTILKPKTWTLALTFLKVNKKDKYNEKLSKLKSFIEEWDINRYVNLKESDNTLLLDLNNNLHLKFLINKISKSESTIILTEMIGNINQTWIKDEFSNQYNHEIVVPLIYNNEENKFIESTEIDTLEMKNNIDNNRLETPINDAKRIILPGDDNWLYFQLYYINDRLQELIAFEIREFCDDLKQRGIIDTHFYILYSMPKNHVRLRIKTKDYTNIGNVFVIVTNWLKELKARFIINDVSLNVYVKEIERYGGVNAIEYAEKYFEQDSILIETIISLKKENQLSLSDDKIGIVNMLSIMKSFGLNLKEQEIWLTKYISPKEHREEFKSDRKNYMKTIEEFYLLNDPEIKKLIELMNCRDEILQEYKKEIDELDGFGKLTNTKEDILSSIIHMSFNRYKGNNDWERRIRALTRHSVYSYEKYRKNYSRQKNE